MEAKNLGGAILGGVIAGASLGVGFILAQRGMSKLGKKDMVSTRPLVIEETSNMTGLGLVKNTQYSNASGVEVRTDGKKYKCFKDGKEVPMYICHGSLSGGSGVTKTSWLRG